MANYTLNKAVKLCRFLETKAFRDNKGIHFALGGSCLMNGKSEKDFDIYVYSHSGKVVTPSDINRWMISKGFDLKHEAYLFDDNDHYDIDKPFSVFEWDEHRIDLFYVSFNK